MGFRPGNVERMWLTADTLQVNPSACASSQSVVCLPYCHSPCSNLAKDTTSPPENETRRKLEDQLLSKLYDMGILSSTSKVRQGHFYKAGDFLFRFVYLTP